MRLLSNSICFKSGWKTPDNFPPQHWRPTCSPSPKKPIHIYISWLDEKNQIFIIDTLKQTLSYIYIVHQLIFTFYKSTLIFVSNSEGKNSNSEMTLMRDMFLSHISERSRSITNVFVRWRSSWYFNQKNGIFASNFCRDYFLLTKQIRLSNLRTCQRMLKGPCPRIFLTTELTVLFLFFIW